MKKARFVILIPILLVIGFIFKDKIMALVPMEKKTNIVVIQLEAFQNFVLQRDINGKEITPNLNKLIKEGMYFSKIYQQNGAGSTSDAEFMFNTGLYPLKPPLAASTGASNQKFNSLPRILGNKGYSSYTFHTNNVIFWNRKEFYSALGFDKYYDKKSFEEKDVIAFGSSDDVLYEGTAKKLEKLKQPFYAHVIGMSSHYPFEIPEKLKELEIPDNLKGTTTGNYLVAANYADAALGRFIDDLKEKGLWDNTVLVVYGDHMGLEMKYFEDTKEKQAIKTVLGRDYDEVDALNIPLIIAGSGIEHKTVKTVGGHIDIMPTLAGLVGIPLHGVDMLGKDILEESENVVGMRGHYVPESSFVTQDKYFNSEKNTIIDLETRKVESAGVEYQKIKEKINKEFEKSDKIIEKLPVKDTTFGREITLVDNTTLYEKPSTKAKSKGEVKPQTLTAFDWKDDGWYKVKVKNKDYWVKPKNPMVEIWSFIDVKKESALYKEPNEKGKPLMRVEPQNLFVSKEWVGTGWYQVFTWAGKDVWVKVE